MSDRLRRLRTSEEGSALALALAFLSLFGLLVGSLLGFTETGLKTSKALTVQGDQVAAAGGAVDGAINRARGDLAVGVAGYDQTCFSPPAINGVTAAVRCTGQPGSGAVSGGGSSGGSSPNVPPEAILALASSGEDGIVKATSGTTLNVTGPIASRSTVTAAGTLAVDGVVRALGDCSGTITSTSPPLRCANTGGGAGSIADPGWAAAIAAVPTERTAPSCGAGWLVTFQPGTYRSASALNTMFSGSGSCAGKVFWFQPGSYYFPFDTGATSLWTLADPNAIVIGGTPSGWSTSAPTKPAITVPNACDSEAAGVQFVFGGAARIRIQAGTTELCAPPNTDSQRIAIYGLAASGSGSSTTTTLTAASASSTSFTPATAGRIIDGVSANATTSSGGTVTATLSSWGGIPAGATISGASLRISQAVQPGGHVENLTAVIQPASGPAITVALPKNASLTTDTIDLLAAGLSPTADMSAITVTYNVEAKSGRTPAAQLDGAALDLAYSTPGLTAQSGCVTTTPFPASGCPFIDVAGASTTMHLRGTVYAPLAAVQIAPTGSSTVRFRRGIVARTVRIDVAASWTQSAAAVSIPVVSTPLTVADRVVVFVASIGGTDRVRARVTFADGNGATPGATVTVNEWAVVR